jgi:glucosyl-3-phosphoglycerate phosphatase
MSQAPSAIFLPRKPAATSNSGVAMTDASRRYDQPQKQTMILVRHVHSASNAVFHRTGRDPHIVDPELTEVGRCQAEFAAWRLNSLGARRIVTSPYKRALQTAEIIAGRTRAPIFVEPLVGEHVITPSEIGSPLKQLKRLFPGVMLDRLLEIWWPQPRERESQLSVHCSKFVGKLLEVEWLQETAIVTYWGFIRASTGAEVPNCTILNSTRVLIQGRGAQGESSEARS